MGDAVCSKDLPIYLFGPTERPTNEDDSGDIYLGTTLLRRYHEPRVLQISSRDFYFIKFLVSGSRISRHIPHVRNYNDVYS